MRAGVYNLSLYCECGTTIQYSGLEGADSDTRKEIERLIKQHEAVHEQVTAREAREIRYMEERRRRRLDRREGEAS